MCEINKINKIKMYNNDTEHYNYCDNDNNDDDNYKNNYMYNLSVKFSKIQ